MPPYAFFDNRIIPLSEAKIGIMTHALHYGTACFDGIRGNWNEEERQIYLFRAGAHYERLHRSCRIMKMDIPYTVDELCRLTVEVVEKSGYQEDVYVRPLAYKSSQTIGVRLHDLEDSFLAFVTPFGPYLDMEKGARCGVSTWRRVNDNMIPARAKITGLYANSALAKTEAWENGFDEAILLTQEGHVSEGSGENIFILLQDKLITPPPSDNILVGITRDTIIQLAREEMGVETIERQVDRSELYIAEECFLTGTAAHLTPVVEVDHRKVGSGGVGEFTRELQSIYLEVVRGKRAKYLDWCLPVYSTVAQRAGG